MILVLIILVQITLMLILILQLILTIIKLTICQDLTRLAETRLAQNNLDYLK